MRINDCEYQVRLLTAGDLAVLAGLAPRIGRHLRPEGADLPALLELWPEIIAAAETLLQPVATPVPEEPRVAVLEQTGGPPDLRALELHEAVAVLQGLLLEWLALNGPYVAREVAPAVTGLARTITAVAAQIRQAGPAAGQMEW